MWASYAAPLQDAARLEALIHANQAEQHNAASLDEKPAASLDVEPADLAAIPCDDTKAEPSNRRGRPKNHTQIHTLDMWLEAERPGMYQKLDRLEHVYACVKCGRQVKTHFGSACARKCLA